jgi:8-oxo-dGTP diphosphatase
MPIKQVFSVYPGNEYSSLEQYKYCPFCGTALTMNNRGGRQRPSCLHCGFTQYRNPAPGVVVVVKKEGSILLGKRKGAYGEGKWGLPQGYIEFDEDFLNAAIREVKEETGLDIEIRSILNVASNHLTPSLHTLAAILLADVVGGNLHADDDVEVLEWFSLSGPLPEMAFEADTFIIDRCRNMGCKGGLPVDPDYALPRQ